MSSSYVNPKILEGSPSNTIISNVAAAVAGRNPDVAGWREARDQAGRLEVLLNHTMNLGKLGCGTALDERLGSLRTKRHLSGTSSKLEVSEKLSNSSEPNRICWRKISDVRQATNASVRSLKKGLLLAREKVVKLREKALAQVLEKEARFLTLGIQILVDRLKGKEIKKYNTTLTRLVDRTKDCSNHVVCNWMRKRISQ